MAHMSSGLNSGSGTYIPSKLLTGDSIGGLYRVYGQGV